MKDGTSALGRFFQPLERSPETRGGDLSRGSRCHPSGRVSVSGRVVYELPSGRNREDSHEMRSQTRWRLTTFVRLG
jgi:hypothetical protein